MRKLQTLLQDIDFESLPPAWTTFDLARFSKTKALWDYQQEALQNALKALWKFYSQPVMMSEGLVSGVLPPYRDQAKQSPISEEIASVAPLLRNDISRKNAFYEWYADNQITLGDISLGKKRENASLLAPYYPISDSRISYEHFINRMGFWMATGSGKTLVIVKLLEMLWGLMRGSEIPANDVLVLTHREDLLKQLRDHVNEYNASGGNLFIRLKELKEYSEVKRGFPSLLGHQEITVFYYRSDNMSDEQKERIIDFRNYDNNGHWYVLLDEAHKGDKEDSKRQHIYSILSRNGFLFNFSATFTDDRDKLTTAAEFNLASFTQAGYGKHISILKQENRAFRKDEDFTDEEKQKIVLQSLLVLAYINKAREGLLEATRTPLYHRPLLLALVNSVNTEDADLKLFFAQLERIAKGELGRDAFSRAKTDLWNELKSEPEWLYENAHFIPDQSLFNSLTLKDVLKTVFNAESHGAIEVLARPSNDKELAFKLQTTSAPFALIRIGETSKWQKDMFTTGYVFIKGFEDESFFEHLNTDDSDINLLMGSRSFYEGWDSNRPNVITFINIGIGTDAKKFILQSVGRGVRIEPMTGKRKRLASLDTAREIDHLLFQQARPFLPAVETLFIFGTNRAALESVFKELDQEKEKEEGTELALEVNLAAIKDQVLLVPTYRYSTCPLIEQRTPRKFELPTEELAYLKGYLDYLGDERLLLALHDLSPQQIGHLQTTIAAPETYFNTAGGRKFGNINILLPRLARYLDILPRELEGFKPLDNEINHYLHIRVLLKDIEELRRKIKAVQEYQDPAAHKAALKEQLRLFGDIDAYTTAIEGLARTSAEETFTPPQGATLKIKNIAAHYYVPLLLSEEATINYIRHIIHVPSEVTFINQLECDLKEPCNLFASFDWWVFSRADETLDKIVIPYYDPSQNKMREFHPDFIFWLKRWNDYFIIFVDPKGMRNADYQYKIDGYKEIFVDRATDALRVFKHNGMNVRVALAMFNSNASESSLGYSNYWYDSPKGILKQLVASQPSTGGG